MNTSTLPGIGVKPAAADQEDGHVVESTVARPNYPFPPSSPEFTDLLMRCFVEGRNAAIDQLEAEQAREKAASKATQP